MPVTSSRLDASDVAVLGRVRLPRAFGVEVTDEPAYPCDITCDVRFLEGRYEITRLEARQKRGGSPIDANTLRQLPLRQTVVRAAESLTEIPRTTSWSAIPSSTTWDDFPPSMTWDDFEGLERVAVVYATAFAVGLRPTKTVSDTLGLSPSTASKRVMAARAVGLLPPATPGKAGA